jgi:hypothetical protein
MYTDQEGEMRAAELKQALGRAIERQIMRRAWGRIRALAVEVSDSQIVIRGRAPSYSFKQLAVQGVLDLIEAAGPMRIEMDDLVVESPS